MKAHETLPFYLQIYMKYESIEILYLYLEKLWWFTFEKTVWVSTNLWLYKQRWTICHELGHYINKDEKNIVWAPFWKQYEEKRADKFAMEILLPVDTILEEWEYYEWDLCKLECVFWVDREIIEKRIKQIFKI